MLTVRLDPELETRIRKTAERKGETVSDFVRKAVQDRCDQMASQSLAVLLEDYVGSSESGRMDSANTGKAFKRVLAERNRKADSKRP